MNSAVRQQDEQEKSKVKIPTLAHPARIGPPKVFLARQGWVTRRLMMS